MIENMAPVVIFCYNRKDKLEQCINSLMQCYMVEKTDVIVFSDGAKNENDKQKVESVRVYLDELKQSNTFNKFDIIERSENYGLARSVIEGVTAVIEEKGRVIVVEDDLLLSKDFLTFMNDALTYYDKKKNYGCISAYTYPLKELKKYKKDIYITRKGDCWGWATWADRWKDIDWQLDDFEAYLSDNKKREQFSSLEIGLEEQLIAQHEGRLDAWAARWCFHLFNKGLLTVYPAKCRAINIGQDGSGTNCSSSDELKNILNDDTTRCCFDDCEYDKRMEKAVYRFNKPRGIGITKFVRHIVSKIR